MRRSSTLHGEQHFGNSSPGARRLAILALALAMASGASFAQEAPFNASLVGNFDQPGSIYADVWGDGDFAYIARFGQRVVDIIDITDPANPVLAATYDSGVSGASAQDVKVAGGLMFVGLESVSPGCQIVDVRDPYAPVKLTDVTVLSAVHNVFYDEGWLYLVDSGNTLIDIVDLTAYDPNSPPATISTQRWRMTGVGGEIVHDITVQDGRLYASAWDSIRVYDVSDVANTLPPLLGMAPGDNVHAAWATDDGRFLVVGEEKSNSGLTLYEIIDEGPTVTLEARGYHFISSLRAGSVHNVLIDGNRVYVSWYAAGVQVLEIDPDTATWVLVASFDTTADDGDDGAFDGNWGVYPFLGPEKVLASDRDNGLFVIDVDPNILLFYYPDPLPFSKGTDPSRHVVPPGEMTPITLLIKFVGDPVDPPTVMRHVAIDGGMPQSQMMVDEGGGLFSGTLPEASCGSVLALSVSADNTLGMTFVDPPGAPAETYRIDVATDVVPVLEDDFDLDMGWTVTNTNLTTGAWERGDPIGTGAQPEFDATGDVNGSCFFTGQGPVGGDLGVNDVDDGPTVLTSPEMDVLPGGAIVQYSYWLFNNDEDGDDLVVEISSDGVSWIEARRYGNLHGHWHEDQFHTADFVAPSATTRVRFSVADAPNNSITEAAVDNFKAFTLICDTAFFSDGFESGDTTAWSSTVP